MSDRCYLEKCRDGSIRNSSPAVSPASVFPTEMRSPVRIGEDLVRKDPAFHQGASRRLDADLGEPTSTRGITSAAALYLEELTKNIEFAQAITLKATATALKRNPKHHHGRRPLMLYESTSSTGRPAQDRRSCARASS